ncbi:MAG: DUF1576 domain-containing protein [Candidatus Fimivivens sp.]
MKKRNEAASIPDNAKISKQMCLTLALSLIATGFCLETPKSILDGLTAYILCSDILITDYFVVGSIGAALVNAGLVTLISIGLTLLIKTPYNGGTISMIFMMASFSLFGKNPLNILPFFLGVWIYAKVKGKPMSRYTNAALFSTTLAPLVSDILLKTPVNLFWRIIFATGVGALIGYIIIPLAEHSFSTHMGYTLFNYGFTGGLLALMIASVSQAMGGSIKTSMIWYSGFPTSMLIYLIVLITALIGFGFILCNYDFPTYWRIMRHSGRAPTDFVITDGIGATMMNMGAMGVVGLGYVVLVGGDLNGPVCGAILTAVGFGAAGEHPKNTIPIVFGVWIASHVMVPNNTDPGMLLAALFSTALGPISGQFGWPYGIIAGFLHAAVVLAVGAPCGGYNLYNNGFSAGLVALVMASLIHGISPRWRNVDH